MQAADKPNARAKPAHLNLTCLHQDMDDAFMTGKPQPFHVPLP